ncbi:MAG: polyribonucleotide nucleotidyltransferase [Bacillota bacterium]|jgi:polyribonucleotide nucleotidyltransferase
MEPAVYETTWAGRRLVFELGKFAKQATSSVLVRYGETVVLVAAVVSDEPKECNFLPLTVNYEERLYAVGKIPGGFIKREGRPSEKAILASRLVDRPLRPLFSSEFRHEVQVVATVLSVEQDCSSELTAMLGASLALMLTGVPFRGPVAGVGVGLVDGKYVINPTAEQEAVSSLNLIVAGTADGVNMVEAGMTEIPEATVLEGILFGYNELKKLLAFQARIVTENNVKKPEYTTMPIDEQLKSFVGDLVSNTVANALEIMDKKERDTRLAILKADLLEQVPLEQTSDAVYFFEKIIKATYRNNILTKERRPDGRGLADLRLLSSEVGVLPRTHGSGLFARGHTQVLSVCTLGALGDVQILDGLDLEESKHFMLHYNFPPYSVGEARPLRAPGRREVGHGALGARALKPVLPTQEQFPYTVRIVSEVLASNGSTSQASICAATLALMDAGVPIKAPVAGVAMGLVSEGDKVCVLTDIQGVEDFVGDMDFKVAGTRKGLTALQMDIKITGIDYKLLEKALMQAKDARLLILENIEQEIQKPRATLSCYAPKIIALKIDPEKIRLVVGPGGRMINKIIEDTGVKIDIEQDGRIFISSFEDESNKKAQKLIEELVREVEIGQVYMGTVKRIEKYGVFVEVLPGKECLVHISQLDTKRIERIEDAVKLNEDILVKVTEIDSQGRIKASRKEALVTQGKLNDEKMNGQ